MKRICGLRWALLKAMAFGALALIVVMGAMAGAQAVQDDPPVVKTGDGLVRGVVRKGGGAEFLGIPFAQPPVGALRWHEPLPGKAWDGVRDAKGYSAPCAQPDLGSWNRHDAEIGKEDCLYLNVVTPAWPAKTLMPVMF